MSMRSWIRSLFTRPATRTIRKAPRRARLTVEALENRWCPSTITVLNIGDDPGVLTSTGTDTYTAPTLRAAIDGANVMAGADTINFDTSGVFSTAQTITLGGTQLELTDTTGATTITGPGVTISGGGLSRVLQVDSLVTASISGLTISGGNGIGQSATSVNDGSGGGLYNSGTATLTNCTFSGNSPAGQGGGLYNSGTATLTNCTFSGNSATGQGGGLLTDGTATLTGCTFSHNTATDQGGGLEGHGSLTLTDCTFSHNTALGSGGLGTRGAATLIGCTFTGNSGSAGGGVGNLNSGLLTLTGCTFTGNTATNGNGGGVQSRGPLTMTDCIFTGNTATNNGGGAALTFPFTMTDCTFTGNTAVNGDGGGLWTRIGPLRPATMTNCTFTGNTAGGNGGGVALVYSEGTVTLTGCTISGNNANQGGGLFNVGTATLTNCTVTDNSASASENVRYSVVNGIGSGGGVFNSGTATLTNCTVADNSSSASVFTTGFFDPSIPLPLVFDVGSGGGVYNSGGTATLTNCTVTRNSASAALNGVLGSGSASGGGLFNSGGTATLTNCTVSGNSASVNVGSDYGGSGSGGGVYNSGTTTLTNCTVSGNSANINGGGLWNANNMTLTNCTVSGNNSARYGGGLLNNGTATLTNCTVSGNGAGYGGGVFNHNGTATLTNCTVSGNSAGQGGGIFGAYGNNILGNTIVGGNSAYSSPDVFGPVTSSGHNLIGNTEDSSGWVSTDLTDASASPLNLGPLADNGGPTQTMALLPGSVAINAGSNALIAIDPTTGLPFATDQRGFGFDRIVGGRVDIGAYELQQQAPLEVTIDIRPEINLASNGVISLALYGSDTFDVTTANLGSFQLSTAAGSVALALASHSFTDLNGDGHLDLVLHFRTETVRDLLRATYGDLLEAADTNDGNNVLDAGVSTHQSAAITLTGEAVDGVFAGTDLADLFLAGKTLKEFLSTLEI